jgi:GT2 family glycosyltransferase
LVAALRAELEAVVAYGIATYFGETNREPFPVGGAPSGVVDADCVGGTFMTSPGQALLRRSALLRVGGFDPEIWGTDDWDLWIRLAQVGPFVYKPVHTLTYRVHRTNASNDSWRMYVNARKVIRKNYGGCPSGAALRKWVVASVTIRKRYAHFLRIDAARAAGVGSWWRAYRAFGRSVRAWPVALRRPTVVLEFLKLVAASVGLKAAGSPDVCDIGRAPVGHGSARP